MFVKPWDEESKNIFKRLSNYGRARTTNVQLVRNFSKRSKIRELSQRDMLTITHNRRKRESWFNIPEDVFVTPHGPGFFFKRNKF